MCKRHLLEWGVQVVFLCKSHLNIQQKLSFTRKTSDYLIFAGRDDFVINNYGLLHAKLSQQRVEASLNCSLCYGSQLAFCKGSTNPLKSLESIISPAEAFTK